MGQNFKAACVAWDDVELPVWVIEEIEAAHIDFAHRQCETSEQIVATGHDADVVWVMGGSPLITAEILPRLTRCGAIIRSGSGTDNIPVAAATARNIIVANTPDATAAPVAEHACAMLLALTRELPAQDRLVRAGGWNTKEPVPRFLLQGRTLGLVGFGRIARGVAARMAPFGLKILAHDPQIDAREMAALGVEAVDLPQLYAAADFISLHTPLLDTTRHLIGAAELAQMKSTCVLINTARGPVVDSQALARALQTGDIAAAGLDVLESEPPAADDPLVGLPNALITSHIAGSYTGYIREFWRLSVETVIDLSQGRWPLSCVNRSVAPRWNLSQR